MNLLILIAIIALPKAVVKERMISAILATIVIVIWSASIPTALGYGGLLMMTLPFCWVIFGIIYFIYWIVDRRNLRSY